MVYSIALALFIGFLYARYSLYRLQVRNAVGYRTKRVGGYIYFFRGRNEPFWNVKIGRANSRKNLRSRLKSHRTANPYGITVLGVFGVKNDVWSETYIHHRFASQRLNRGNEWFRLSLGLALFLWAIREPKLTKLLDSELRL